MLVPILEAILAIAGILGLVVSIFTPRGRAASLALVDNIFHGRFDAIIPHFSDLSADLLSIAQAASNAFSQYGQPIATQLTSQFQAFASTVLQTQRGALASAGISTPENAQDTAATAFTTAFGAGLSSAAVTALFEAVFPEKLNTLNGLGPIIAQIAGFSDVADKTVGPLYDAAFGQSLKYSYLSQFRPVILDVGSARAAFRRRLISQAQFDSILQFNGLAPQYVATEEAVAFNPIPARVMAQIIDDGQYNADRLRGIFRQNGYTDADVEDLLSSFLYKSLKSLRQNVLSAAEANYVAGLSTDQEFSDAMDSIGVRAEAKALAEQAAVTKRLKVLAEDYRKGWDAKLLAQEITVDDYRVALAGLGYTAPVIDGIVGGMSARLDALEFKGEAAETKAQRRKDQQLAIQASMTAYHRNEIDAPALTAAILAANIPAEQAALYVALATARGRIAQHAATTKRTEAQKLDIKTASEQYLKGVFNSDVLVTLLTGAGMPREEIIDTINYLDARGAKGQNVTTGTAPSLRRATPA